MSISSTVRKAGPFVGNSVQTAFPFAFKVFDTADVVVTQAVASVETVLTQGVDYTVALNGDQDGSPGGTVNMTAAPDATKTLVITSNVSALQAVTVTNGGGFFPSVFNAVFDRLTILVQQLAEKLSRTLTINVTASGVTSLSVPVRANSVLMWDPTGAFLTVTDNTQAGLPAQLGQAGKYLFTNGTAASWAVGPSVGAANVWSATQTFTLAPVFTDAPGSLAALGGEPGQNLLINGDFRVNQRAPATTANNTYAHDRWYVLTQTGTVAVSTVTNPENGVLNAARITQSQAAAQRFGMGQIVENAYGGHLRGTNVMLSGRVRSSSGGTIRFCVIEWNGTADSVSVRDLLSGGNWASATYTKGNFFRTGSFNVLATGSVTPVANTWTPFSLAATFGANMVNPLVFFWTDAAEAQNVTVDFDQCKLEPGLIASAFKSRPFAAEVLMCQRYYEKSFLLSQAPGQGASRTGAVVKARQDVGASAAVAIATVRYKVPKRASPTLTLYNPINADAQACNLASLTSWSATSAIETSAEGFAVTGTSNVGSGAGDQVGFHFTADAEL